jgi:[acyl-carrier-protein] S-malonyltransferase
MAPAARIVAAELERVRIAPLAFRVVANVDAQPNTDPSRVKDLLVRQVDSPVRWEASVKLMVSEGVTHILEIGPGKVLAGLIRRISKGSPNEVKVLSINDAGSLAEAPAFLHA